MSSTYRSASSDSDTPLSVGRYTRCRQRRGRYASTFSYEGEEGIPKLFIRNVGRGISINKRVSQKFGSRLRGFSLI